MSRSNASSMSDDLMTLNVNGETKLVCLNVLTDLVLKKAESAPHADLSPAHPDCEFFGNFTYTNALHFHSIASQVLHSFGKGDKPSAIWAVSPELARNGARHATNLHLRGQTRVGGVAGTFCGGTAAGVAYTVATPGEPVGTALAIGCGVGAAAGAVGSAIAKNASKREMRRWFGNIIYVLGKVDENTGDSKFYEIRKLDMPPSQSPCTDRELVYDDLSDCSSESDAGAAKHFKTTCLSLSKLEQEPKAFGLRKAFLSRFLRRNKYEDPVIRFESKKLDYDWGSMRHEVNVAKYDMYVEKKEWKKTQELLQERTKRAKEGVAKKVEA